MDTVQVTSGISISTEEIRQKRTSRLFYALSGPLHSRAFINSSSLRD